MKIIFELSSTNYEKDKKKLMKALDDLEKLLEIQDGYLLSEPVSRFGWTFFKLLIKPDLFLKIDKKFSDMIQKTEGRKPNEKFTNFMSDFFSSRECNAKLKLIKED